MIMWTLKFSRTKEIRSVLLCNLEWDVMSRWRGVCHRISKTQFICCFSFLFFSFLFFSFHFFSFSFQSFLWLGRVSYGTPSSFGLIYACLRKLMLCAYSILSPVADIVYRRYFFVRNWHIMRAVRFSKGNITN